MSAILTFSTIPRNRARANPVEYQPVCHRQFLTTARSVLAASIQLRRNLAAVDTYTIIDNRSRPLLISSPVSCQLGWCSAREIVSGGTGRLLLFFSSPVSSSTYRRVRFIGLGIVSSNSTPPKFPTRWIPFARGPRG